MTYCSQTLAGIPRDCSGNMGGVSEVLIGSFADIKSVTASEGKITTITTETGKTTPLYRYEVRKGTSQFTATLTSDTAAGVSYVTTEIVLQFNRMEASKRVEMQALTLSDLVLIAKDNNGKYWYLGKDNPVLASAGDGQTGTAYSDANRYTITLQDVAREWPLEVEDSVVAPLIAN